MRSILPSILILKDRPPAVAAGRSVCARRPVTIQTSRRAIHPGHSRLWGVLACHPVRRPI